MLIEGKEGSCFMKEGVIWMHEDNKVNKRKFVLGAWQILEGPRGTVVPPVCLFMNIYLAENYEITNFVWAKAEHWWPSEGVACMVMCHTL
jgi:hypothetical protein